MQSQVIRGKDYALVLIPSEVLMRLDRNCEVSIAGERLNPSWGYPAESLKTEYTQIEAYTGYRALVRPTKSSLSSQQLDRIISTLVN